MSKPYIDLIESNIDEISIKVVQDNRKKNDIIFEFDKIIQAAGWRSFLEKLGNKSIWNGVLLKPIDISYDSETNRANITVVLTDYVTLLGSNYSLLHYPKILLEFRGKDYRTCFAERLRQLKKIKSMYMVSKNDDIIEKIIADLLDDVWLIDERYDEFSDILEHSISDISDFQNSVFANCLSLNVAMVADGKVLIQIRGKRVSHNDSHNYQTSVSSFVSQKMIEDNGFNKMRAFNQCMKDELGKSEDIFTDLCITGIVRDIENYEIGITAYSKTDKSFPKTYANNNEKKELSEFKPSFILEDIDCFNKEECFKEFTSLAAATIMKYPKGSRNVIL